MDVNNKYRIILDNPDNKQITIPIEFNWEFCGQEQSIELYEEDVIKQVTGLGYDFEVDRFPHSPDPDTNKTDINYEFYFYSGGSLTSASSWNNSYISEGFTTRDLYYYSNNFTRSFFKLDLYDTIDDKRQTNYITIIIPTQQGATTNVNYYFKNIDIKIPKFKLDYVGDKEGFFIYWLKNLEFVPINTFYMAAKFYNAKTGQFVKMLNKSQSTIPSSYDFNSLGYFYYKVVIDYINKNYVVSDLNTGLRVGTTTPIKWYEYVNP